MPNHKQPPSVGDVLEPNVMDAAFDELGVTADWLACQWWDLAHAKRVVTASHQGKILDERFYADNDIRLKATKEITTLRRLYPKEHIDFTHHLSKTAAKIMREMDGNSRGKLPSELVDEADERDSQ
jgi:hypothetical protein